MNTSHDAFIEVVTAFRGGCRCTQHYSVKMHRTLKQPQRTSRDFHGSLPRDHQQAKMPIRVYSPVHSAKQDSLWFVIFRYTVTPTDLHALYMIGQSAVQYTRRT